MSNDTVDDGLICWITGVYWLSIVRRCDCSSDRSRCSGDGRRNDRSDRSNRRSRSANIDVVGLLIVLDGVEADIDLGRNAGRRRKDDGI